MGYYADGHVEFDNDHNAMVDGLKGNGVVSGCGVTAQGTPDDTVAVASGAVIANGTYVAVTGLNKTCVPHATLPLRAIISVNSSGVVTITHGTEGVAAPAGQVGPFCSVPAPPDVPANEVLIADIWIEPLSTHNPTVIVTADITDRRIIVQRLDQLDCLDHPGTVTTYTDTTHFKAANLVGFGDNFFKGWYVYPVWKSDGTGGAPQGELQPVAAYTSSDGTVQHTTFTVHLLVDDKVLLVHPAVAYMLGLTPTRVGYLDYIIQVYREQIPDTDFALAAIDDTVTTPPPSADTENSVVDIDVNAGDTFVLRSLWVNVTSFGTGTKLTFELWTLLNAAVTKVDSVDVADLGIQNLMDIFGVQEVHADGIWITVKTDVGSTGACSGTYRFAKATT